MDAIGGVRIVSRIRVARARELDAARPPRAATPSRTSAIAEAEAFSGAPASRGGCGSYSIASWMAGLLGAEARQIPAGPAPRHARPPDGRERRAGDGGVGHVIDTVVLPFAL